MTSILFGWGFAQDFSFFERIMGYAEPPVEATDAVEADAKFAALNVWIDGTVTEIYVSGCEVVTDSQAVQSPYP